MSGASQLYEEDFNLWAEQMAIAIRERNVSKMDWDNLLCEIEDMTASQKRALRSYTKRLIEHILKLQYWQQERDRCGNGWREADGRGLGGFHHALKGTPSDKRTVQEEVSNFRSEILDILKDSPSLKNYLQENYVDWFEKVIANYRKNRLFLIEESTVIPLEIILDDNYFG